MHKTPHCNTPLANRTFLNPSCNACLTKSSGDEIYAVDDEHSKRKELRITSQLFAIFKSITLIDIFIANIHLQGSRPYDSLQIS
jgi:hypothetical protein